MYAFWKSALTYCQGYATWVSWLRGSPWHAVVHFAHTSMRFERKTNACVVAFCLWLVGSLCSACDVAGMISYAFARLLMRNPSLSPLMHALVCVCVCVCVQHVSVTVYRGDLARRTCNESALCGSNVDLSSTWANRGLGQYDQVLGSQPDWYNPYAVCELRYVRSISCQGYTVRLNRGPLL